MHNFSTKVVYSCENKADFPAHPITSVRLHMQHGGNLTANRKFAFADGG